MKKHILLVSDHIGQEGTGRFITHLANGLSVHKEYKVTLMTFHNESGAFYKDLSHNVNIVNLNLKSRIRYSLFRISKEIIRLKPNYCFILYTQLILLSFIAPYFRHKGIQIFFRETIIPSMYRKKINPIHKFFIRKAYRLYDKIVAQSNDMAYDLHKKWGCPLDNIVTINNPVSMDYLLLTTKEISCPKEMMNNELPIFISAGRLVPQKGYDIILKRISEFKDKIPFKYYILGEGSERIKLENLIKEFNLGEHVSLLGFKSNVYAYLRYCDALILSSRYEGFPNIVLEAMALGKPVFSNTCLGGINEVIINGENGIACNFESPEDFTSGFSKFVNCHFSPNHIIDITRNRYDEQVIIEKYVTFIENE